MKHCSAWFAFLLLSASLSTTVFAQDIPGASGDRAGAIFAEVSTARTGQGAGFLWGGSAGAYLQGRVLGFVLRATELPDNPNIHIFNAVVGPRLAVSLPLVRAFVEAGGGMGHASYYNVQNTFGSSWGAAWQLDGGVSHGLLPHLDWRILEVAYGHIYAGPGVSPVVFSTGVTLHVW